MDNLSQGNAKVLNPFIKLCLFLAIVYPVMGHCDTFSIGFVNENVGESRNIFIQRTVKAVENALGLKTSFLIMTASELKSALSHNEINAFLAPSFLYRQQTSIGYKDIAALISGRSADPNHSEGISIFIDCKNSSEHTLLSLKGKSIGILNGSVALESMLLDLVESDNKQKNKYFSEIKAADTLTGLIKLLKNRTVSAIALPACFLETHAESILEDTSWMLPINGKVHSSMKCAHSSSLYPGLVFGLNSDASPDMVSKILQALLSLKPGPSGEQWRIVTDFRETDRLLMRLDLDESAPLRKPSIKKFFQLYWPLFATIGFIGAIIALSSMALTYLVKRRTAQLKRSLVIQKELEEEAKSALSRLEKLQKLGAVGQMSSLFAHEIRQPLNAILCYAFTLERIISKQYGTMVNSAEAKECLAQIQEQSARVDQIVEKVRSYLKDRATKRKLCLLKDIIASACSSFKTTSSGKLSYRVDISFPNSEVKIFADPIEIELALVNLFRNSVQAQSSGRKTIIKVDITEDKNFAIIRIEDNGPKLNELQLTTLSNLQTSSSRPEGLGLGLSIVRFLIENHGGTVKFFAGPSKGLIVIIKLPKPK